MKLKKDLVLRQVADSWVVLPMSRDTLSFDGMLTLNESGAMLWNVLKNKEDTGGLVDALLMEYDVSPEQAQCDVSAFIKKLMDAGCFED